MIQRLYGLLLAPQHLRTVVSCLLLEWWEGVVGAAGHPKMQMQKVGAAGHQVLLMERVGVAHEAGHQKFLELREYM